jgi:alpha-amylase/alpha-mannosidase (GH57 family)
MKPGRRRACIWELGSANPKKTALGSSWETLGAGWRSEGATAQNAPEAFAALYAAEGSDWFWWYGTPAPRLSMEWNPL